MGETGDHEKQPFYVAHTEQSASPQPPQKKRTVKEKLGIFNILVLVFGTAAIFVALAFLLFFWIESDNARGNRHYTRVWYQVVWAGWVSKVVTLSTVLIRIATGAQLGVFAALVAALVLERVGASTVDLPQLSIIRCANSGPHSLFRHVIHSIPIKSQLGYSIIIVIAILNSAVLQLTSTILLTDVGNGKYLEKVGPHNVSLGLDGHTVFKNTWQGIDYWTTGPVTYPRFAEGTKNGSRGAYYVDTGAAYRGFLPFGSASERSVVRDYAGSMTVVDTRTVCVKPSFSGLTYFDDSVSTPTITGTLKYKGIPDVLSDDDDGLPFNCSAVLPETDYWAISLCFIRTKQTGWPYWSSSNKLALSMAHLFINMSFSSHNSSDSRGPVLTRVPLEQSETDTLWSQFGHENITFDASVCFFDSDPVEFDIQVRALDYEADLADQSLDWNATAKRYTVQPIINTLGATENGLSPRERGVFQLNAADIRHENIAEKVNKVVTDSFLSYATDKLFNFPELNWTTILISDYGNLHRTHTAIIQNILQQTRNPALALQALFTIIIQMAYYDFFTEFELSAPATHSDLMEVLMPVRWTGLGVILGLLGVHFVLLLVVLVLFLTRTEMSLLGNAWQAVSQVHSMDTADVVLKGAMATDEEVNGKKRKQVMRVRIAKSESSGRAEAMYVRHRQRGPEDARSDEV